MSCIIEIDLDSRSEYISEFDDHEINDRLHQYVLDSFVDVKSDVVLKVVFHYPVSMEERNNLENTFKISFWSALDEIERNLKRLNYRDIVLTGLGFLLLLVYWYLEKFNIFLFAEFFLIISWVVFWEVAESFLFQRRKLISNRTKYRKLLNAKFEISL